MKDTKTTLERFAFCDHVAIRRRMENMASAGWLIEKPGNLFWKFRRIEPKKLTFSVTYFADASDFDPSPTDGQQIMAEFCARHGWVLAARWGQMQIFYNASENPVPIETDPATQVETIHRSMKKSMLPAHLLLLALCIYQLVLMIWQFHSNPVAFLSKPSFYLFLMWVLLSFSTLFEMGTYIHWLSIARRTAENGMFYDKAPGHAVSWILLAAGMLMILLSIAGSASFWWIALLWTGVLIFEGIACRIVRNVLRKKGASRTFNRTVTIVTSVILSILFMALLVFTVVHVGLQPDSSSVVGSYDMNGWEMNIYNDDLPLCVEDLVDVPQVNWSREARQNSTFLLTSTQYNQRALTTKKEIPSLEYTITQPDSQILYNLCKNALLNARQDEYFDDGQVFTDHYEAIDAAPWGAAEAYQVHWSGSVLNNYLLCYENRLVEISFDWEPTAKQMAITGEILGGRSE